MALAEIDPDTFVQRAGRMNPLTNRFLMDAVITKVPLSASDPTVVAVGTVTGLAVAANSDRKGLVLQNTSPREISLGLGVDAVLGSGITLVTGEAFVMDSFTFFTGLINAIAQAANSNLAIQEFST